MKKRTWVFVMAAVVVAGLAITALALPSARFQETNGGEPQAGGAPGGPGMTIGMPIGMPGMKDIMNIVIIGKLATKDDFKKQVGITDDQANKIATLVKTGQDAMKPTADKMAALGNDMSGLVNADAPDAAKIDAKIDELMAVHTENCKQMAHQAIAIKAVLSADQLAKVKDYVAKMQQDRGKGKQGHHGGHGGMGGGGPMGGGQMGGMGGGWNRPDGGGY